MTKTELIEALGNEAGFTRSKAEAVVRVVSCHGRSLLCTGLHAIKIHHGLYHLFKFYLMSSRILHYYQ